MSGRSMQAIKLTRKLAPVRRSLRERESGPLGKKRRRERSQGGREERPELGEKHFSC